MKDQAGLHVQVKGIVQGVGFRPFVYNLAQRLDLRGWVRNTTDGVELAVDGERAALLQMLVALKREAPPLAHIDEIKTSQRPTDGFVSFEIRPSFADSSSSQPVPADIGICPDCLRELFDSNDRHYRYPFVNCTNCGPRFTIVRDLPYDRPLTTMASFEMCPQCAEEYTDPANRRYHAQPVSCPHCGPRIWLEIGDEVFRDQEQALSRVRKLVAEGGILAIKGLGGFHIACDASNTQAVAELRRRKARPDKPFAVMLPDIEAVRRHCYVNDVELEELQSPRRPIVLLGRRPESTIAEGIAPGQKTIGVMLPYTPLHYLLLKAESGIPEAWVMTSGNRSEEPIITENEVAKKQLGKIADAFLLHDRPIQTRIDDSVVRAEPGRKQTAIIRRARGYAPAPIQLAWEPRPTLATGAELKNTFALARDHYAFLSPHIGDLQNYETLDAFEKSIAHHEHLFRVKPELIAYDLHPDYLSTRYALQRAERENIPTLGVQHHHAHIAACMAEHGLPADQRVIGFAFDGTGYGSDNAIWGGEVLTARYAEFERTYHLDYMTMPGGDQAVKQPWRLALAWLDRLGVDWQRVPTLNIDLDTWSAIDAQLTNRVNAPLTSSIGRLFDTVAGIAGGCQEVTYEGQAAIELEATIDPGERGAYEFELDEKTFSADAAILSLVADVNAGVSVGSIASRFHSGLANLVLSSAEAIRRKDGLDAVVLSGGVWQNMALLTAARSRLETAKFKVYTHRLVPANDGGLALGQLAIAHYQFKG